MLMWGILWAIVTVMLAAAILALIVYAVWLKDYPLPPAWRANLKQYGSTIGFWSFWGGIFGAIGSAALMRFTGLPRQEALLWILFGVTGGLIWGALWGAFWQMTSR